MNPTEPAENTTNASAPAEAPPPMRDAKPETPEVETIFVAGSSSDVPSQPALPKTKLRRFFQGLAQLVAGLFLFLTPVVLYSSGATESMWVLLGILAVANLAILICFRLMGDALGGEIYLWIFMNLGCALIIYLATKSLIAIGLILFMTWFFWP